jgi:benzoyl-CoA reductase/2-hydroxyglutaryl-CoA dehydratase subunit BcrC/BadD/HgdB
VRPRILKKNMKLFKLFGWPSALCLSASMLMAQEANQVEKFSQQLKQMQESFEKQQKEMKESFERLVREHTLRLRDHVDRYVEIE